LAYIILTLSNVGPKYGGGRDGHRFVIAALLMAAAKHICYRGKI
jgi:hypothetical protein